MKRSIIAPFPPIYTPDGVRLRYPAAKNPYELFDPDSLASLERRIALSEADPKNRELFVSTDEVMRVVGLNAGKPLPAIVAQRLEKISRGEIKALRGRPPRETPLESLWGPFALKYYRRNQLRLRASPRLRERARRRFQIDVGTNSASECAAEMTRRKFYAERMSSWQSVMNLLSSMPLSAYLS